MDICNDYVDRFGIRFNPSESQTTVFGGRAPPCFAVKLNDANVPYVDEVKYFGLFIDSRTNKVDHSAALSNFLHVSITLCLFLVMVELKLITYLFYFMAPKYALVLL